MGLMSERKGILAGGNFILDQVKIIDAYPEQDMLATILEERICNGGGPYNVLKDLAAEVADEGDPLQRFALFQERASLEDKRVDDVPIGRRNGCRKCVHGMLVVFETLKIRAMDMEGAAVDRGEDRLRPSE